MKLERKIYLTLSTLPITLPLVIAFMSNCCFLPTFIVSFLVIFGLSTIFWLFFLSFKGYNFDHTICFLHGLITFKYKKVIYKKFNFYIKYDNDSIYIYTQGFLSMKKISNIHKESDLDSIRDSIKAEIDVYMKEEITSMNIIKDWDGYLDKQSKRSDNDEEGHGFVTDPFR